MGIKEKKIDMGHARAILGSPSPEQQLNLYKKILQNGLSVRRVEELVSSSKPAKKLVTHLDYTQEQRQLSEALRLPVKIQRNKVTITFKNEEDLHLLIKRLR